MQVMRGKAVEPTSDEVARISSLVSTLVRKFRIFDRDQKFCLGVTIPQCYALETIGEGKSLRMQEVAERLGVVQSTVTRILAPLERKKLVRRESDPADGRVVRLRLTKEGQELQAKLRQCSCDLFSFVLALIPKGERESVVGCLERLSEALEKGCACLQ